MAKRKRTNNRNNKEAERRPEDKSGASEDSKREDITLDRWQREVLETGGRENIALRAGRQVGKSTVISRLAAEYAAGNKGKSVLIISATERQAYLLFTKVLMYLDTNFKTWIKKGKDRPTKTEIKLNNKSIIRCLPTGLSGLGIRGYTVDLLIADEAAFIPQEVWPAVIPMLVTTGGKIILLSTPFGKSGYFYESYYDDSFKSWHIKTEDVAKERKEPQRTFMLDYINKQKQRMSTLEYMQEFEGEFVDELRQLFSDDVIKKACVLKRQIASKEHRDFFLGVDIARLGDDEGTYEIIEKRDKNVFRHVESIVTKKKLTTETFDRILSLEKQYCFRKIGIDAGSGSLGVGILDFLLREPVVKRKVIALNNLQRVLDHTGERKRGLLKEDMYMNMLALMEKGYLKLLDDDEVIASLRSVQYEYIITVGKKTSVRIFGNDTHIAEGLVRAAWLANQKHLNLSISWI